MTPLLKTLTYSTMHFLVAVTVTLVLTQDWRAALAVGIVEPLVQTFAYAGHEKIWSRIVAAPHGSIGG